MEFMRKLIKNSLISLMYVVGTITLGILDIWGFVCVPYFFVLVSLVAFIICSKIKNHVYIASRIIVLCIVIVGYFVTNNYLHGISGYTNISDIDIIGFSNLVSSLCSILGIGILNVFDGAQTRVQNTQPESLKNDNASKIQTALIFLLLPLILYLNVKTFFFPSLILITCIILMALSLKLRMFARKYTTEQRLSLILLSVCSSSVLMFIFKINPVLNNVISIVLTILCFLYLKPSKISLQKAKEISSVTAAFILLCLAAWIASFGYYL